MLNQTEILQIARALEISVKDLLRVNSPVYKEQKTELLAMDDAALAAFMATEPTLIKRPIIQTDKGYSVGFHAGNIRELIES